MVSIETTNGLGFSEIHESAFEGCTSLSSIKFREPTITDSRPADAPFIVTSYDDDHNVKGYVSYPIEIHERAFYGCKSLNSIVLPNGIYTLNANAFSYCSSLKSVTIYNDCGFSWKSSYIFIESPIEEFITDNAPLFLIKKETSLKKVVSKVFSTIGSDWKDYKNLEELVSLSLDPPLIDDTFSSKQYLNVKVTVPTEALEAYRQADVWKNFWNLQGGATTGINTQTIKNGNNDTPIYDISGRIVTKTVKGQVYIKNGKKFIAQ